MPRKSLVCPKCGSRNTVELVYGYLTLALHLRKRYGDNMK